MQLGINEDDEKNGVDEFQKDDADDDFQDKVE